MRGKLITIEGIDGAGKTTQVLRLEQWLESTDERHLITRQPAGTTFGYAVSKLIQHPVHELTPMAELLLFAADRAQHVGTLIDGTLNEGRLVVCDRYTDSTIAYQGYGRGIDLGVIEQLNQLATGGLKPDATIWLEIPPDVAMDRIAERGEADSFDGESLEFWERVHAGYRALADAEPGRVWVVDATQSENRVFRDVLSIVWEVLKR
ncbi:MAG: dTMP kinase [Leptolyngbyaceae cyanobacterium]